LHKARTFNRTYEELKFSTFQHHALPVSFNRTYEELKWYYRMDYIQGSMLLIVPMRN